LSSVSGFGTANQNKGGGPFRIEINDEEHPGREMEILDKE